MQEGEDPWNAVRSFQLVRGTPVEGHLYVLWGVRGDGPEGPEHPYAQLNLARDGWAGSGTHLLVWLDGLGEIPRFAKLAPDLWSMRSLVEEFLSLDDFAAAAPAEEPDGHDEAEIRQLQAQARALDAGDDRRRWVVIRLSSLLRERHRLLDAWQVLGPVGLHPGDPHSEQVAYLVLDAIGRPGAARRMGRRLLHPGVPPELARGVAADLALRVGEHERGIRLALEAWSGPFGDEPRRANGLADLASALVRLGRLAEAERVLGRLGEIDTEDRDALCMAVRRRVAAARGDLVGAVAAGLHAASGLARAGRLWNASWDLASSATWLLGLGAPQLAAAVTGDHPPVGPEHRVARAVERVALIEGGAPGELGEAVATAVREIDRLGRTWPGRGLAARSLSDLADRVAWDHGSMRRVLDGANRLRKACADEKDDEPLGMVRVVLARLHLGAGDPERAAHHARHLLEWAEAWRGRSALVWVRCLLADIHVALGELEVAGSHADEAVAVARGGLSLYDLSAAAQLRARVDVARGEVGSARTALLEALDVVRAEGLRPEMIEIHLALAGLPAGDDRVAQAREALALARSCRLVHAEARALLRLAELAPPPWGPRDRAAFARAERIVRELGPRSLRSTVARLAALSGPPRRDAQG